MQTPRTERDDVVETLHGHRVADPYRWLEDPSSPHTRAWVEAQRAHCDEVFSTIPERAVFQQVMGEILSRPRAGTPWYDNGWYLRRVNDGTQPQDVLVGAKTLPELFERPQVLLDPNTWSADGTTSLATAQPSPDGRLLLHGVSEAGSDWTRLRVLDLETGECLPDEVMAKHSLPLWFPDGSGFIYSHYDSEGEAVGTDASLTGAEHLMMHTLGGGERDLLSFPDDPRRMFACQVLVDAAADGGPAPRKGGSAGWLVASPAHGTNRSNALWVAPVTGEGVGEWVVITDDESAMRWPIAVHAGELLCLSDEDAPLHQVVAYPLRAGASPRVVLPAGQHTLDSVVLADGVLVVSSLQDAQPVIDRWSLDGEHLGRVAVEGGAVMALSAQSDRAEVFVGLSTAIERLRSWRLDAGTGELTALPGATGALAVEVTITRHRAPSKDGTDVPYFLIRPVHAPSGPRPTLLYGYGGFSIPVLADYRPGWEGWLAVGGTLVIANLRGGGEFGSTWYEQGRRAHKQNVFDDCIGVAEHLVATGITTSEQLALYGRSNGGLLGGACMTQRPDLFAAAIPQVGVLDLLRFHLFTIGAAWISDYGDPDDPTEFEAALAYSPLHRVREGVTYPATLVVTGDHDDRVVPAHSHKFTATLQAVQPADPEHPIVSRIEASTGHGAGKPTHLQAAEWADILAFAAHFTGLGPARAAE